MNKNFPTVCASVPFSNLMKVKELKKRFLCTKINYSYNLRTFPRIYLYMMPFICLFHFTWNLMNSKFVSGTNPLEQRQQNKGKKLHFSLGKKNP